MAEVRLTWLSAENAAAVVAEHDGYFGFGAGFLNNIRQDGTEVVTIYFDERWPLDIVDWA